jgi:hypothetical protein
MSCVLLATLPGHFHAAEPEPLDAEFLEYLGACEGKDDNWTVVANKKLQRRAAQPKKPPQTPPPPKTSEPREQRP